MFTMSNERMPLGIEGAPTTKTSPVGIVILVVIIVLACAAVYYYSPEWHPGEEGEGGGGPTLPKAVFNNTYSDIGEDTDGDGYYNNLSINVDLLVENEGEFKIIETPYILAANKAFWFLKDSSMESPLAVGIGEFPTMREPMRQKNEAFWINVTGFFKTGVTNLTYSIYGGDGSA